MEAAVGATRRKRFDPTDPRLLECIERATAPYRPVLPTRALLHFHRVATFLVETHPAASRWFAVLHPGPRTRTERDRTISQAFRAEHMDRILEFVGFPPPSRAPEEEEDATVLLHEAEAGLRFLVEARFPLDTPPDACGPALDRFLALTFASLFAGLVGALFRRQKATPRSEEVGRVAGYFIRSVALIQRFDPRGRDARTFDWYFVRRCSIAQITRHTKGEAGAEQEIVACFLEKLGAFVRDEGPRLEADIGLDPARLSPDAKPWALTLLRREMRRPGSKRRLPS